MMNQEMPFSIVVEKDAYVIRADRALFDAESLTRFLSFLRIESLRNQSKATESDVDELAQDVNRAIWQRLKPVVLPNVTPGAEK